MKVKTAIKFIGLVLFAALAAPAGAQTNPVAAAPVIHQPADKPDSDLVTRTGAVYKNFHVDKTEPHGIVISYTPKDGGFGIARISFAMLPDKLQKLYGYDPSTAPASDEGQKPQPETSAPAPAQSPNAGGN